MAWEGRQIDSLFPPGTGDYIPYTMHSNIILEHDILTPSITSLKTLLPIKNAVEHDAIYLYLDLCGKHLCQA